MYFDKKMLSFLKRNIMPIKIAIVTVFLIFSFLCVKPAWDDVQSRSDKISTEIEELTKPPESNTIELPMYFDFESTELLGKIGEVDFPFILELTYPNGSLIANDVIHVKGTAFITHIIESLDRITLAFPNSLEHPKRYQKDRLLAQGILVYENPFYEMPSIVMENTTIPINVALVKEANITFPIEGEYRPIIGFRFKDNSTKYFEARNTILHVYPEEQLKQLETERIDLESNLASLELSKAVFILTFIAMFSIVIQIISYNSDKCKHQPNEQNEDSKIKEKLKETPQTPEKHKLTEETENIPKKDTKNKTSISE
jgi:hypothetical protein